MLYNPEWQKTNVFALHSLISWLEKQPAHMSYEYKCNGGCMLAQYFAASGFQNVNMGTANFYHGPHDVDVKLPQGWNYIAHCRPRTFGAALERARAIVP